MQKTKQLSLFLLLFSTLTLLSACGSKGDLYPTPKDPQENSNKKENNTTEKKAKAELINKKQP
ncbi:MAG: lipoprotein [Colwellia sp.]